MKHAELLTTIVWLSLCATSLAGEYTWPQLRAPSDAVLSSPGESMAINGIPVRIYRFDTAADVATLTRMFAAGLQSGFTRRPPTSADPRTTLGGRVGDFWLTLQIASLPNGHSRATWSAAPRFMKNAQLQVVRPPGFPRDAQLLQQVDSFDDGKNSQLAVGLDRAAIDAVAARMQDDLRDLGYAKKPYPPRNWSADGQYSAVFGNGREELVVSLKPEGTGTAVVINRISALERLK